MYYNLRSLLLSAATMAGVALSLGVFAPHVVEWRERDTAMVAKPPPAAMPDRYARHRLSSGTRVTIESDSWGQFHADVEIEGRVLPMMVDTGATTVSLSWNDAVELGLHPRPDEFNVRVRTANGIARAALVRLREVRVGGIIARDVPALIAPPGQSTPNLLGMSFLNSLRHFEVADRRLVLEQ